jgi:hypothetical protein
MTEERRTFRIVCSNCTLFRDENGIAFTFASRIDAHSLLVPCDRVWPVKRQGRGEALRRSSPVARAP